MLNNKNNNKNNLDENKSNNNNDNDNDSSKRQDDSDIIAMKNKLIDSYKSAIFDKNQLATMKQEEDDKNKEEKLSDNFYTGWASSMIVGE
jgi:hypothetical protein